MHITARLRAVQRTAWRSDGRLCARRSPCVTSRSSKRFTIATLVDIDHVEDLAKGLAHFACVDAHVYVTPAVEGSARMRVVRFW